MELLSPAGSLPLLRCAVRYGADAVYLGGEAFSLRAAARNFTEEEMREGIRYAHAHGVRVYVTANIFAHNGDLAEAARYFSFLGECGPDALIISDPGMFRLSREYCPEIPVHISTQANSTNYETFLFWHSLGVRRIVCARELSLAEISEIREKIPEDMEIEAFVHGAMCISYSGRCLLSAFLTGRDANRGECTHPCRWEYLMEREDVSLSRGGGEDQDARGTELSAAFEEITRPGEVMEMRENGRGTFLMNSKDLRMIGHIPEMEAAGISALKIEGRMKNALYVASVTRAYRYAVDLFHADPARYAAEKETLPALAAECAARPFTTGFYFGKPGPDDLIRTGEEAPRKGIFIGTAEGTDAEGRAVFSQKNKFSEGDTVRIIKPVRKGADGRPCAPAETDVISRIYALYDADGNRIPDAPHPHMELHAEMSVLPEEGDVLVKDLP